MFLVSKGRRLALPFDPWQKPQTALCHTSDKASLFSNLDIVALSQTKDTIYAVFPKKKTISHPQHPSEMSSAASTPTQKSFSHSNDLTDFPSLGLWKGADPSNWLEVSTMKRRYKPEQKRRTGMGENPSDSLILNKKKTKPQFYHW